MTSMLFDPRLPGRRMESARSRALRGYRLSQQQLSSLVSVRSFVSPASDKCSPAIQCAPVRARDGGPPSAVAPRRSSNRVNGRRDAPRRKSHSRRLPLRSVGQRNNATITRLARECSSRITRLSRRAANMAATVGRRWAARDKAIDK